MPLNGIQAFPALRPEGGSLRARKTDTPRGGAMRRARRWQSGRAARPKSIARLALLLSALLLLAGCQGGGSSTQTGRTVNVTVRAGEVKTSGISPQAFLGTFDQIARIEAQAFEGATLLDSGVLTDPGTGWSGSLFGLPIGPTLTFNAQGFNASSVKIFEGSLNAQVVEGENAITIPMNPLDDGTGFPTPSITGIVLPAIISISATASIEIQAGGVGGTSLTYTLTSGGGTFNASSGTISLDAGGIGSVTVSYTAPATTGTYSHAVTVTNSQTVSATAPFDTVVGLPRCVLDMSKLDQCTLGP